MYLLGSGRFCVWFCHSYVSACLEGREVWVGSVVFYLLQIPDSGIWKGKEKLV